MRRLRTAFGLLGLAATLSAAPGMALSASPAQAVSDIAVNRPVGASPEFAAIFRQGVSSALSRCADARPVALQVEITRFRRATPNEMGGNSLSGVVTVIDAASRKTLGEYQITGAARGGPEGTAALTQIQSELSSSFGQQLCQKAFSAS